MIKATVTSVNGVSIPRHCMALHILSPILRATLKGVIQPILQMGGSEAKYHIQSQFGLWGQNWNLKS